MAGDMDTHDAMVACKAESIKDQADTIVFAQASMTRLALPISESTGLPVYTSPRLGVEYVHKVLQSG
jgi:Asp/Glu/hydantoin racemase